MPQRELKTIDSVLKPLQAYEIISKSAYWYMNYNAEDRRYIASCYSQIDGSKQNASFSKAQISRFYDSATLILDSLAEPGEVVQRLRVIKKPKVRTPYGDADPGELKTIGVTQVRERGWTKALSTEVVKRLSELKEDASPSTLAKIFFGPIGSSLRMVEISSKLDSIDQIKEAIDQGRIELLQSLDKKSLRAVRQAAFKEEILIKSIKFAGGSEYCRIAQELFSDI